MRVEHLRQWLREVTREKNPDDTNWIKLAALMQAAFQEESLTEACAWKTVVMFPKGGGKDFIGIRLVEVLWKATTSIINRRLTAAIR